MPPAASTGIGRDASTTSGTSTIVAISPVWPPASLPWATMMSTPAALLALGVLRPCRPARPRARPRACARSTMQRGGGPSALAIRRIGWAKTTSSSGSAPLCDQAPADAGRSCARPRRAAAARSYFSSSVVDERAVLARGSAPPSSAASMPALARRRRTSRAAAGRRRRGWPPTSFVDPRRARSRAARGVRDGAEHAEPAGLRDRGDDVAAVA